VIPTEPSVRARHLKTILEALAAQPDAAEVLAAIPPASRTAIEEATGIDWLDVGHDLAITAAAYRAMGKGRADACFRGLIGGALEGPLLRTLVAAARRLFGLEPRGLAQWIPKAWSLIFRACGEWQVTDAGPRRVDLVLRAIPPALADDPVWPRSVAASLEALFDVAGVSGTVGHEALPEPGRALRFRVAWQEAGPPRPRGAPGQPR
jgi:hypothetical protein